MLEAAYEYLIKNFADSAGKIDLLRVAILKQLTALALKSCTPELKLGS